ncbi:MAG: hypothetical protein EAX96_16110 [Candidatus Lokiarchaeota archaeon]|nr:hypothetical protein [Candidatus Lokiarchaeota archaeon]
MEFNWNLNNKPLENYIQTGELKQEFDFLEMDEYEQDIIALLTIESIKNNSNSILSFQGIKRKLNTHQQILSRSLKRLEEKGFLKKLNNDYLLTNKAILYFSDQINKMIKDEKQFQNNKLGIKTIFGTNITRDEFLNTLKGTWFSNFRYIGWYKGYDFVRLKWLTESNDFEGNATYQSGKIMTETNKLSPEISDEKLIDKNEKFKEKLIKKLFDSLSENKRIYYLNSFMVDESKEKMYENLA